MVISVSNITKNDVNKFNKFRWSLVIGFLIFNILLIITYKNPNLLAVDSLITTALLFIIAVFHGRVRYGNKIMVIFFLITLVVSFSFENLSIFTGFPFGFYHYSPSLGLLTVPLIIIFAYSCLSICHFFRNICNSLQFFIFL